MASTKQAGIPWWYYAIIVGLVVVLVVCVYFVALGIQEALEIEVTCRG